jgi:glycerol-3-phosphate dehydrogenase (NAD(P)+)
MLIQVVGSGSWGLAIARLLALRGHKVRLWGRDEDGPEQLRYTRQSPHFLPGMILPEEVEVIPDCDPDAKLVVLAVPSHAMRQTIERFRFRPETVRVSVAKGIETDTLQRMSEVVVEASGPCKVVALSGPSHAEEVAQDLPASVVAGCVDEGVAEMVQNAFMTPAFRVYTSRDITGVELGGSLKNVVAIAAGVCDGFGLGDNAKAALITRGLAEMARLGAAMGAEPLTFAGLSGMGDLIATCESRHSRNRAVGERLAAGEKLEEIVNRSQMVAEGVRTTWSAQALSDRYGVDMPITHQVYKVLFEGADPREAVESLMTREAKPERA